MTGRRFVVVMRVRPEVRRRRALVLARVGLLLALPYLAVAAGAALAAPVVALAVWPGPTAAAALLVVGFRYAQLQQKEAPA